MTGRFEFEPGALKRLRDAELTQETRAFSKRLGKRAIAIDHGMEREWTVRGFKMLHQGRVAMLERNDGVALAPLAAGQQLAIGKSYSISIASGKFRASPSLGLNAEIAILLPGEQGNRGDATRRHAVQRLRCGSETRGDAAMNEATPVGNNA